MKIWNMVIHILEHILRSVPKGREVFVTPCYPGGASGKARARCNTSHWVNAHHETAEQRWSSQGQACFRSQTQIS